MKTVPLQTLRCGFSLVELLVVIAVIAIIAAVALPNLLNISHQSTYAKNRRNAQTVAVVAASAKAAGATNDLSGTNAISLLQPPGVTAMNGGIEVSFTISPLSDDEVTGALSYLEAASNTSMGVQYKSE